MSNRSCRRGEGVVAVVVVLTFFILAGSIAAVVLARGANNAVVGTDGAVQKSGRSLSLPSGITEDSEPDPDR